MEGEWFCIGAVVAPIGVVAGGSIAPRSLGSDTIIEFREEEKTERKIVIESEMIFIMSERVYIKALYSVRESES